MSQPPPYGGPPQPPGPPGPPWPPAGGPGFPAYPAPQPRRPRPSGWWFVAGGALVLVGVVVGVALFAWTLLGFLSTDATVQADGTAHVVQLDDPDKGRMIWWPAGQTADCRIVDMVTGEEVEVSPPGASFDKSDGSGSWRGAGVFDPGSGTLEVTCSTTGGPIQIGPSPQAASFVGGILATVLAPLLLGGAGLIVLLVTTIRYVRGEPRPRHGG